jgi:type II secretory pathway pseudopilin PulG
MPTHNPVRNPHRRRSRAGFGLLTTMVFLAVVLTLAGVIVVNLRGIERERHLIEDAAELFALENALTNTVNAASRYPLQLSHTASPPTTSDKNSCGLVWQSGWTTNWSSKSPFGPHFKNRIIPVGTGWPLGIGIAMDTMVRDATSLIIRIPGVAEQDAVDLDLIVDGTTNNGTAGKVRWTTPVGGFVDTLRYFHTRSSGNC